MVDNRARTIWDDGRIGPYGDDDLYGDTGSGQWRWFAAGVVIVPVLLTVGVYWLHQLPAGPATRVGNATIQVELLPSPAPSTEPQQASVQTSPPIADFNVAPKLSVPNAALVEQEVPERPQPAALMRPAAPLAQRPAGGGEGRPIPAGTMSRFQHVLLAHIERFQHYPSAARIDGGEETVFVIFAMRRDGTVSRVEVKSSSGQPVLDQAAIETIRRAQPLPHIPAEMPDMLTVSVPVTFKAR